MKEKILKLRKEGKSYKDIKVKLGCSLGTISYHCGEGQKEKSRKRQAKLRATKRGSLRKKLNKFRSRGLIIKSRDFQRKRNLNGSWKGVGRYYKTFEDETLFKKIIKNPVCYLTGVEIDLEDPSSYSFDHIEPIAKGGTSNMSNLGLCTRESNMSKHKLTVQEYLTLCKKVLENNGYKVTK